MRQNITLSGSLLALSLIALGCHNASQDSAVAAKDSNSAKIDSANSVNQPVKGVAAAVSKDDAKFVVDAAEGGMMEVQLGQLAQQMAAYQRVKSFGAMMERDHSRGGDQLKVLAEEKSITLPGALSPDKQKKMDDLKKDKNFDKDYIKLMVEDHKEDIKEFTDESQKGSDADIRAFADSSLHMLQMHLDSAKACQSGLKKI